MNFIASHVLFSPLERTKSHSSTPEIERLIFLQVKRSSNQASPLPRVMQDLVLAMKQYIMNIPEF